MARADEWAMDEGARLVERGKDGSVAGLGALSKIDCGSNGMGGTPDGRGCGGCTWGGLEGGGGGGGVAIAYIFDVEPGKVSGDSRKAELYI